MHKLAIAFAAAATTILAAATVAPHAAAQGANPPATQFSVVDDPGDGWMTRAWRGFKSAVGGAIAWITPPGPRSWALALKEPSEFQMLMHHAGYRMLDAESGLGLLPDASVRFTIARELSEADVDWLERQLARDAKARSGIIAGAQRSIVRTLIDAHEIGQAQVTQVAIDILPLPKVSYTLAAKPAATLASIPPKPR